MTPQSVSHPTDGQSAHADTVCGCSFDIMCDPASIATAQQKLYSFCGGHIRTFNNPKVARGMRIVTLLAKSMIAKRGLRVPPHGTPIRLSLEFRYAIPKTRSRGKNAVRNDTPAQSRWTADVDNRAKAVMDALTNAGLWADDQDVTTLVASKRWTDSTPLIRVSVEEDRPQS